MAGTAGDPPTDVTARHERRPAGRAIDPALAAEIDQQKRLIFELFSRGESRQTIKLERNRLRQLQHLASGGAAAEETAIVRVDALLRDMDRHRSTDRMTARPGTDRTAAPITTADTGQLDALITQERRVISEMFRRGEERGAGRDRLKQHRDRLRMLERQRDRLGAVVVEADARVVDLSRRRSPRRLLHLLLTVTPFVLFAAVVQQVSFTPWRLAAPWGTLILALLPYPLLIIAWYRLHHFRLLGILFPLAMISFNTLAYTTGLLVEPDWSLALGLLAWVLLGLGIAFVDPE